MILRAIEVQGWRCFPDPVRVGRFAEGLTVLHAPNTTGKSTLFEALLRALLDGHRVTGRDVEALRPWGRQLAPTVAVEFAHAGVEYRLSKRFLERPSSELERDEGVGFVRTAEGEAADEFVRALLTQNPPGRGLARQENWGLAQVLWAPQGQLAFDSLSGDIVRDIRSALGAQLGGPGSGVLEQRIEEAYERFFTRTGKMKSGKDAPAVVGLCQRLATARESRRAALEKQRAYEEAARQVENLRARRAQSRLDAEELERTLADARAAADVYSGLLAEKSQRAEAAIAAEARYSELKRRIDAIKKAETDLAQARETLRGLDRDLPLRARDVEGCERTATQAKAALEDARKGRGAVDEAQALAEAARGSLEARRDLGRLEDQLRRIGAVKDTLARRKHERSRLVAPDAKMLRSIRQAIRARDEAQIQLEAALITLEIVAEKDGSLTVIAGEETGSLAFEAGRPTQIKGSPEVVVDLPGVARIRAQGPAGSIEELRANRDRAVTKLKSLTEGFGTADLDALESLRERAAELDTQISEAATQLDTLLAGEAVEDVESERARVAAVLEQITRAHPEWGEQAADFEGLQAKAAEVKRRFIEAVEKAERAWEFGQSALAAASEQRAALAARREETGKRVQTAENSLRELTVDGKKQDERETELRRIALEWDAARAKLEEVEKQLDALGDDPRTSVERLGKRLQAAGEAAEQALEKQKLEEGRLLQLSAEGPYSMLGGTEEEVAALEREIAGEQLKVDAIRLLRDTVEHCRAGALAQVAAPVEAAATRLLQRIAGTKLGRVQLDETFAPVNVVPDSADSPVSVYNASGGEREQIYLATRLALAEVLAKGERQLVVLDDVLLATDAGRLARVHNILEETAQRLQLLVLTCHPERYRGIDGAAFFDLEEIARGEVRP